MVPGNFKAVANVENEIHNNQDEIVKELVKSGETERSATEAVQQTLTLLRSTDTVSNGISSDVATKVGLSKIIDTGLVKSVAPKKKYKNAMDAINSTDTNIPPEMLQIKVGGKWQDLIGASPSTTKEVKRPSGLKQKIQPTTEDSQPVKEPVLNKEQGLTRIQELNRRATERAAAINEAKIKAQKEKAKPVVVEKPAREVFKTKTIKELGKMSQREQNQYYIEKEKFEERQKHIA